jgi:hypothetical protein
LTIAPRKEEEVLLDVPLSSLMMAKVTKARIRAATIQGTGCWYHGFGGFGMAFVALPVPSIVTIMAPDFFGSGSPQLGHGWLARR